MNLHERLCHQGPDKSNGQKNDEQNQNTNFSSFFSRKRKVETWCFHLFWLRRLQPNFKECRTICESTEKTVKNTSMFCICMLIYFILIQIIQMHRHNGVYSKNFAHACNKKMHTMLCAVEKLHAQKSDCRVLKKVFVQIDYRECTWSQKLAAHRRVMWLWLCLGI